MENIQTFEGLLSKFKDQIVQSATNIFNPRKEDNEIADNLLKSLTRNIIINMDNEYPKKFSFVVDEFPIEIERRRNSTDGYILKIDSVCINCSYYRAHLIFNKVNSIYDKEEEKEEERQLIKKDIKNHFRKNK